MLCAHFDYATGLGCVRTWFDEDPRELNYLAE
jgi:hypothetical protein